MKRILFLVVTQKNPANLAPADFKKKIILTIIFRSELEFAISY